MEINLDNTRSSLDRLVPRSEDDELLGRAQRDGQRLRIRLPRERVRRRRADERVFALEWQRTPARFDSPPRDSYEGGAPRPNGNFPYDRGEGSGSGCSDCERELHRESVELSEEGAAHFLRDVADRGLLLEAHLDFDFLDDESETEGSEEDEDVDEERLQLPLLWDPETGGEAEALNQNDDGHEGQRSAARMTDQEAMVRLLHNRIAALAAAFDVPTNVNIEDGARGLERSLERNRRGAD